MVNHHNPRNRIRKSYIVLLLVVVFSLLLSGCGAEKPKVYRVGILSGLDYFSNSIDGFKAKMTELGYVEGQNITYDLQKANFDMAEYKRILQQFVADKVDLIYVFPTEAALEAKAATEGSNIPVVFGFTFIEGNDLVQSIVEPGGNITGVRYAGPDLALKRFEVLRELAPQAKYILIPYQRDYPSVPGQIEALRPVAADAGITLIEVPAANTAELEAELQTRAKAPDIGVDAVLMILEPLMRTPDAFAVITNFAAEHKLVAGGALTSAEGNVSVFGIAADNVAVGKQAASLTDKIFKGTPPGTLSVVSAENYLQINYKAAQEQGLTVPDGLLRQADEIIK
jgi:putative ABC transport system substrate-binding protein